MLTQSRNGRYWKLGLVSALAIAGAIAFSEPVKPRVEPVKPQVGQPPNFGWRKPCPDPNVAPNGCWIG